MKSRAHKEGLALGEWTFILSRKEGKQSVWAPDVEKMVVLVLEKQN